MQQLQIYKLGGKTIENKEELLRFLNAFGKLSGPKILVHGGGKMATELAQELKIPQTLIDGRRVTDAETLKIITMVYAGLVNKQIVAQLQAENCNALGLSGADGNLIRCKKRANAGIDFGFVGDLVEDGVNTKLLQNILTIQCVPVICAVTHDGSGQLLNTNADTLATKIAIAMKAHYDVSLTYCFEQPGVMADIAESNSVITALSTKEYRHLLATNKITTGMIPKLENAFWAKKNGIDLVRICNSGNIATHRKHNGTLIIN